MSSQTPNTTNSQTQGQPKGTAKPVGKLFASGQEHQKKHKGGRPPKPEGVQLLKCVKVYFTEKIHRKLKAVARRHKKPVSELCREYILEGHTLAPITKEQSSHIRKLAGMSTNLNQLAHESHVNFNDDLANRVSELANKIDEVLVWLSSKVTHG